MYKTFHKGPKDLAHILSKTNVYQMEGLLLPVVTFHPLVHSSVDRFDSIPKKESAYSSIEDDNDDNHDDEDDNMLYDGSLYSGFTEEEREFVPQSGRWFST